MTQQTHLVFGTGLIGGYLGGVFLSRGMNTTFLGRAKSQAAMQNGLQISDFDNNTAIVGAPFFYNGEGQFDIIWVAVKCTATASIVDQLGTLLNPNSTIICCQNGFGSDKVIRDAFPKHQVLSAIVVFNVAEISNNHLFKSTEGELIVEQADATIACFDQLCCDLMPSRLSNNITAEKWAKLQLNLGNAVNALADIPVFEMLQQRDYRRVMAGLMKELLAVTKGLEIELPKMTAIPNSWIPSTMNVPNWLYMILAKQVLTIDPKARASMWWDLTANRSTEVEYLNAAVVRTGESIGIDCPMNRNIVQLIHDVERGEREMGIPAKTLLEELLA
jgi:2-dehydropantoate 2-reductase